MPTCEPGRLSVAVIVRLPYDLSIFFILSNLDLGNIPTGDEGLRLLFRFPQLPETYTHLLMTKHRSMLHSYMCRVHTRFEVLRNEWRRALRFVPIQQVRFQTLRVINRNALHYVRLQVPAEVSGHLPERVLCRVLDVVSFIRLGY